jgi:nucleoside-diphosphate-sugar epimerase
MKAMILGCGYVGQEVARLWQQQGHEVTATTTSPERLETLETVAQRVILLKGDQLEALQEKLADQDCLLVSVGPKRGASYRDTYLLTAQTLANILPQTSIQQVIYTSTYSVYGDHQGAWVTEESPVRPTTDNGKIMAEAEQTLLNISQAARRVCVLRLGGIYGPERTLERIFSRTAGTTRPGQGQEASNWVHRDDIVRAIDFVQTHQLQGLYNVVQDDIPMIRELIAKVCDRNHLAPVTWDSTQSSDRPYNARVSNQKLKTAGFTFLYRTFDE